MSAISEGASEFLTETAPRGTENIVPRRTKYRLSLVVLVLCALGFAAVGFFPHIFYHVLKPSEYLVLHIIMEFSSILVSMMVFVVGWYGYKPNANKQALFIAVLFLAVGLIDFVHTMSYKGMPNFLSVNTVSKASTLWVAARLLTASGLLAAAVMSTQSRNRALRPWPLLAGGVMITVAIITVVTRFPHLVPPTYIDGVGLTPLKVLLEWVIIFIFTLAALVFGLRGPDTEDVVLLQLALMVSIFSEASFTLYASAFDTYNLLGHTYKVVAYYLIFRALFVSSFQMPYRELVRARDQIEHSFGQIGTALSMDQDLRSVMRLIAELSSEMLGTRHAAVMLLKDGNLHIEAYIGMAGSPSPVSMEHTSAGEAVRTMRPVIVEDIDAIEGHSPDCHCQHLDGGRSRSVVAAPIVSDGKVMGVVEVCSTAVNSFGEKDAELLAAFARQAAVAMRNSISHERDKAVAETLQRSLLPSPPRVPGLDIAVRYEPSDNLAKVGGDLYDVFKLDKDHLAIVIGDVCGHGLEAASTMAMMQHTVKGFMMHGMSPSEALQYANRALCGNNEQEMQLVFATAFAGILNIQDKTLRFANAGHPMPVLIGESPASLDLKGELPLGIDDSTTYTLYTFDLSAAFGLILFTDGVVEARKKGEMFSVDRLSELCTQMADASAEEIINCVIDRARSWSGSIEDDIALLTVKWGTSDA